MRWQLPVFAALVQGPSMAPTLRHGDALLIRRGNRVRPGDLVVARFRVRPDLLVVKRAVREQDGGWWVRGDNDLATDAVTANDSHGRYRDAALVQILDDPVPVAHDGASISSTKTSIVPPHANPTSQAISSVMP